MDAQFAKTERGLPANPHFFFSIVLRSKGNGGIGAH